MPSTPKWPWITLIVLEVVQLVTLVPWLMVAGLSVMAFDAPGSTERWEPWAFVLAIWSYPLWLLLAAAASWTLFAFQRYVGAVVVASIFTLPAVGLLAYCVFITMV